MNHKTFKLPKLYIFPKPFFSIYKNNNSSIDLSN